MKVYPVVTTCLDQTEIFGVVELLVSQNVPSYQLSMPFPPAIVCVVIKLLSSFFVLLCPVCMFPTSEDYYIPITNSVLCAFTALSEYTQPNHLGGSQLVRHINWNTSCGCTLFSSSFSNIAFSLNLIKLVEKRTQIKGTLLDIVYSQT